MGIVSRLREFVQAKYEAERAGRMVEAEAYGRQVISIEHRAGLIRQCFLFALVSLAGSTAASLLLGLGLYLHQAAVVAVAVLVAALIFLLLAVINYIREVRVALSSVRDEARDLQSMNTALPRETREPSAM